MSYGCDHYILLSDILVGPLIPPRLCTHLPKTATTKSFRANPTDCPGSAVKVAALTGDGPRVLYGLCRVLCMWVFQSTAEMEIGLLDLLLPIKVSLSLIFFSSSFLFAFCSPFLSLPLLSPSPLPSCCLPSLLSRAASCRPAQGVPSTLHKT